jgi:hypothetical protein
LKKSQLNIIYIQKMVDNGGTDATPRSRALCGGFCGELPRSALFLTVFFNIIIFPIQNDTGFFQKNKKIKIFISRYTWN